MKAISWSLILLAATFTQSQGTNNGKALMCYFGSWSTYRWSFGHFDVEDIDPFLCTHLVFGFAGLDQNNFTLISLDPYNDLYDNWGKGAYQRFTGLKTINPQLKTLLAIGGWNEGATKYSQMASDPAKRSGFIQSALDMVLTHNFDGLDLDWEYPGGRADSPGKPEDKENFAQLLRELRPAFDKHGLLLTAAVSAGKNTIDKAYEVTTMSETLDFINVMTYDFHGWWEDHAYTGHNSPLYPRPDETDEESISFGLSTDFAMRYWRSKGAAPEKLLLGMGAYGRGFNLVNPSNNGLYAPAASGIDAAMYTSASGFWGYNEYCEKMLDEQSSWTVVRDDYVVAPYAINGGKWLGYDDEESVRIKSQYILDQGYGGGMVWSIDTDDFHGFCTGKKFGLIATIKEVLQGSQPQPTIIPTVLPTKPSAEPPKTTTQRTPPSTTQSNPLTTSTSNSEEGHDICGTSAGMKPDPNNCNGYYVCVPDGKGDWILHHGDCPVGLHFDAKALFCNWPSQAHCQPTAKQAQTISKFTCPGEGWFSDGVCSPHFYECVDSDNAGHFIAYEFYCPTGTVFDNILLVCNYPWLVSECNEHESSTTTMKSTTSAGPLPPSYICHRIGLNENPYEDCSSYYYDCQLTSDGDEWKVTQLKCDFGLIFDPRTLGCTAASNVDECDGEITSTTTTLKTTSTTTTSTTTTTEEPQVCQHPGLNPDPSFPRDCSIYFACKPAPNYPDHWLITQCNCPDGLAFDPDLEVCTWPSTLDDCKSLMKATFEVGLKDHEDCTARIKRL